MTALDRIAQRWLDRPARRAPRLPGFSQDDGLPDRGRRYGGAQTIHNTGTIDIVLDVMGNVTDVWFRCRNLAFTVSEPSGTLRYTGGGDRIVAVEVLTDDGAK